MPTTDRIVDEILGYLNFSNGTEDTGFQRNVNELYEESPSELDWIGVRDILTKRLETLKSESTTYADSEQAEAIIRLTIDHLWPAYRKHHSDLLFHLADEELQQPLLLVRFFEAALSQGEPWGETDRIVEGALLQLNDYLGFRPVAVLENGRKSEPYECERFRPAPLFLRGAGVASGRYQELITGAIDFFVQGGVPESLLLDAHFSIDRMDEMSLDLRAHDHMHPVNKRTNYMFGEWDPHVINTKGFYTRFVLRRIILDALVDWIEDQRGQLEDEEVLFDASVVLCGTMLMASAISGCGPDTYDSSVSLTGLLPHVARLRDGYYSHLMDSVEGTRAERLNQLSQMTQQPFGHVRQHLNLYLAGYGAEQVQQRHLAVLYARMGHAEASQQHAAIIPSVSARFECDIEWRITAANLHVDRSQVDEAVKLIFEAEELLHRGIRCGGFVDPWNILGFQGQFPLFISREDSIPDQRVEALLEIMERLFGAFSRVLAEAAARGDTKLTDEISRHFHELAEFWDRFATTAVDDIPEVRGVESWESATHVARAMAEWNAAGSASGDILFWRSHVEQFQSSKSFAQIAEALLQKGDLVAAMGLLMQWLSQAGHTGMELGPHSIYELLVEWLSRVLDQCDENPAECRLQVRRLFAYIEANAGEFWSVPSLDEAKGNAPATVEEQFYPEWDTTADDETSDEEDEPSEEELFQAAYDNVIYKDSALDGQEGELMDDGFAFDGGELESICRHIEPRLRFLTTLAQMWQMVPQALPANGNGSAEDDDTIPDIHDSVIEWRVRSRQLQADLMGLLNSVWEYEVAAPDGSHDSNVEYDLHIQTKFYLIHTIIATHVNCRAAERSLLCCLPQLEPTADMPDSERLSIELYRAIFRRDTKSVKKLLPQVIRRLSRLPLLYVPLDNGGHPQQILAARTVQSNLRFLLTQLPRLGLLRETWVLLKTAYKMERSSRPGGLAVTEFDRLFRTALRNTVECIVHSADGWGSEISTKKNESIEEELNSVLAELTDNYNQQWLKHSRTMRLSTIEGFENDIVWEDIKPFIEKYGGDLFHARNLTLGNVRAILHHGPEWFLDYLEEHEDPDQANPLLKDLQAGELEHEQVVDVLDLIYGTVVDKFDRFLEYNTTTTQSDYGELFWYLLDFLRVEAAYDRDAWRFIPYEVVHEVLTEENKLRSAEIWESNFQQTSNERAEHHGDELRKLEQFTGIRLPSVSDRINERFIKPLAVNRMRSLIPDSIDDARNGGKKSDSFTALRSEIDEYMQTTSGSGLEVSPWLQSLEKEVQKLDRAGFSDQSRTDVVLTAAPIPLTLKEVRKQLKSWNQPFATRAPAKRRKSTKKTAKKKPKE